MEQVSLSQWDEDRITTGVVYNHTLAKLISRKTKARLSRKQAFLSVLDYKKSSSRLQSDERVSVRQPKKSTRPQCEQRNSLSLKAENARQKTGKTSPVEVNQKLQVFVRGPLVTKTLCLQLDPKTSISSLKELIQSKIGVEPRDQHLYIGRNFQLCDLLTIADHGIQNDQNIELRAGGLLGGGQTEGEQLTDPYFLSLSKKLGPAWTDLAIHLGFTGAEVSTFQANDTGNVCEQGRKMLVTWMQRQENPGEAPQRLRDALNGSGRADLASELTGSVKSTFDIKQCAGDLKSHYLQTMKVTTHPLHKDESMEMDDLYVKLQLLRETNRPATGAPSSRGAPSSLALQLQKDTRLKHPKATRRPQRRTPGLSSSDEDNRFFIEKVTLNSYEDMLKLNSKRILITAETGYGKSTLFKKIAYDWALLKSKEKSHDDPPQPEPQSILTKYELVFIVEVARMGPNFNIIDAIFSQILTDTDFDKSDLEKYIRENQENVLILLDGVDEISFASLKGSGDTGSFNLENVLSFSKLKSCTVVATSRQYKADQLLDMFKHYTKINVAGFDEKDREIYVEKFMVNFDSQVQEGFLKKINDSQALRSLGEIPLFLWLMCYTWITSFKLPDKITKLFRKNFQVLYQHKEAKKKESAAASARDSDMKFEELGRIALEGLLNSRGVQLYFKESEIDSKDLQYFSYGCDVGLLSETKVRHGLERDVYLSFLHKTFQEYCAANYLVHLFQPAVQQFDSYLSRIFEGDVESVEYILRFCCGLDMRAAESIIGHITVELFKKTKLKKSLLRIVMSLLYEARSTSLVEKFMKSGCVEFPHDLKSDDLLAAHYVIKIVSTHRQIDDVKDIVARCHYETDLTLLDEIISNTKCKVSLTVSSISWDIIEDNVKDMVKSLTMLHISSCQLTSDGLEQLLERISQQKSEVKQLIISSKFKVLPMQTIAPVPFLKELRLHDCGLTSGDIEPLFSFLSAAGSIKTVSLRKTPLHGLQPVQIAPLSSLGELYLYECSLENSDMEPLFSLFLAVGSLKVVVLSENNLHGLQPVQIEPLPSLSELHLYECGLTSTDIEPLFSLLSAAGSIEKVILSDSSMHGLQRVRINGIPSLNELHLYDCHLTKVDIEPLFSLLSAAGSVKEVVLKENNLHGLQPVEIDPLPSLGELRLYECGLKNNDIEPLFSLLSAVGSVKEVVLSENDLHKLLPVQITPLDSLEELHLYDCGLENTDIEPLFSLVTAAGKIKTVFLEKGNFQGLQPVQITPISSLNEVHLHDCGLKNTDIQPLFSLLSAAGSVKEVVLKENNLHGLQPTEVIPLPSLRDFRLYECGLTNSDIGPLFSLLSAAASLKEIVLSENNLHGLKPAQITPLPSLEEMHLYECGLTKSDIEPLFSLLSAADSIKTVLLYKSNIHDLQPGQITPVPSLDELHLYECGLTNSDIKPLFSLLSEVGSVKELVLSENNLHGLQPVQIKPLPTLDTLHLYGCSLTNSDMQSLFSLLSASGSVKTVLLNNSNLHGLQPGRIPLVPSLEELHLYECGLTNSDLEPLFSLLLAAGNIKIVCLRKNTLHGLQPVQITPVPSLDELHLYECGLTKSDIEPLFSLLSEAGTIKEVVLKENNLHGLEPVQITPLLSLEELTLYECGLTNSDIEPLFSLLSAAGSIMTVSLEKNNLHGLQPVQITPVPSLDELHLYECGLTNSDIRPLFSLLSAAGSVTMVCLRRNNLHGLQPVQITPVPSLDELHLYECGLANTDIEPLFSLLSAEGGIKKVVLKENDLQGLVPVQIDPLPYLGELCLYECRLTNTDIEPLFSLLSAAGSITEFALIGNNLHGLQHVQAPLLPSLHTLYLYECGLTSSDIEPLFSLLSAAGSEEVVLKGNNLHGLQRVQITQLPSLVKLRLHECGLTKNDIEPLFSLLSSAGSIKEFALKGNNLHGLQPVRITPLSSLNILLLYECGLTNSDVEPLFSLVSAAGSISKLVLSGNNLHRLQPVQITPVPSLGELRLQNCELTNGDIEPLFSLISAAGSISKVVLSGNNLHMLQPVRATSVPTLDTLHLYKCGLRNSDVEPLFSLLSASAGNISTVVVKNNNLHSLQPSNISPIPSLDALQLSECGLENGDIKAIFHLLSSLGSVGFVELQGNRFDGKVTESLAAVPSLELLVMGEEGVSDVQEVRDVDFGEKKVFRICSS